MTTGIQSLFDAFLTADHRPHRIVFPDGHDPRIVSAAAYAGSKDWVRPVLLGSRSEIEQVADDAGASLDAVEILDPEESRQFDDYAIDFAERRGIPLHTARCMTTVPFYFAAMMLCSEDVDAMIAGAQCSSQEILMATDLVVGTRDDVYTPSSFVVMQIPGYTGPEGELLVLADCVVNPEPDCETLADIALATADTAEAVLDWDARVAMLSHSTHGHPLEPRAEHVSKAVDIVRRRAPGLKIDGELQLDAALNLAVAQKKLPFASTVAGCANVLIFPDMNAGNIAIKMAHELAGATLCGPVLQGFAETIGLVSRGATTRDILGTIALTGAYATARKRPLPRIVNGTGVGVDARAAAGPGWSPRVVRV
jgi:phosphate acetyltransferase